MGCPPHADLLSSWDFVSSRVRPTRWSHGRRVNIVANPQGRSCSMEPLPF